EGEETVVNFVAHDGTILKTIRARGGSGARSGTSYLPDGIAELTADDINLGSFRISTLMPVNAIDVRDGLVFILGGDWTKFFVPVMPFDAVWFVLSAARWNSLHGSAGRGIFLSLIHPSGRETSCQPLILPADHTQSGSFRWGVAIGATFDT